MLKSITQLKNNNNNNNNNDNNGNSICVLNVQLKISPRIGNLQMLLEIGLFKKRKQKKTKRKKKKRKENKRNQNCIKSELSQFLSLQQKM